MNGIYSEGAPRITPMGYVRRMAYVLWGPDMPFRIWNKDRKELETRVVNDVPEMFADENGPKVKVGGQPFAMCAKMSEDVDNMSLERMRIFYGEGIPSHGNRLICAEMLRTALDIRFYKFICGMAKHLYEQLDSEGLRMTNVSTCSEVTQ